MVSWFVAENKVVAVAIGSLSFLSILYVYRKTRPSAPLPPGPPPVPVVGNIFQMPKEYTWIKYAEWEKQYGENYLVKEGRMLKISDQVILCIFGRSVNT